MGWLDNWRKAASGPPLPEPTRSDLDLHNARVRVTASAGKRGLTYASIIVNEVAKRCRGSCWYVSNDLTSSPQGATAAMTRNGGKSSFVRGATGAAVVVLEQGPIPGVQVRKFTPHVELTYNGSKGNDALPRGREETWAAFAKSPWKPSSGADGSSSEDFL